MKYFGAITRFEVLRSLLLLFVFSIPLSQAVSSVLLIVTCSVCFFVGDATLSFKSFFRDSWDMIFYVAVLAFGLLFSEDLMLGLKVIETNLCFLAVPTIFSRIRVFDKKLLSHIFYSFAAGLGIACLICIGHATVQYSTTHDVNSFFFYNLTEIVNLQPTYFAYYLIFVIAYGLYQFYYHDTILNRYAYSLCLLFFFFVLMLTGGQTAFVSAILVCSFFILKFLTEHKTSYKRISIGLVIFMILGMFAATFVSDGGDRKLELNDAWDRLVLWESAIEATPNVMVGVGTGDYKAVLNSYYVAHGMTDFAKESFNAHNQFIQLLFSNGLIGVLALVIMLARPMYLSAKNQNPVGILLFFPFLIYGTTEVFLGRYQGVVFFVFLHQFLIAKINNEKKPLSEM